MRQMKPRAYLQKEMVGHWCFEPIVEWVARDICHNTVARGKTRKECEANCRELGFVPERW